MILIKKMICCVLSLSIVMSALIIPSYDIYAYTKENAKTIDEAQDHWSEICNFLMMAISEARAVYVGNYEGFFQNLRNYYDDIGQGESVFYNEKPDGSIEIPEQTVTNVTNFIRQECKDSNGNYTSDSGLAGINYQMIKTRTLSDLWAEYFDLEIHNYGFMNRCYTSYGGFLKDYAKYWENNPYCPSPDVSFKFTRPDYVIIAPKKNGRIYFTTSVMGEYCKTVANYAHCYIGYHHEVTGEWNIAPRVIDLASYEFLRLSIARNPYTFQYEGSITSVIADTSAGIGSDQHESTYPGFYSHNAGKIDQLATLDGRYIKLFASEDDAVAYYKAMGNLNVPNYPYSGGSVTINNTTINYNNPEDSDDPDNPDTPDTPDTPTPPGSSTDWHDPADDDITTPFGGTVTEGLDEIIKYLKKIYHQLILNNVLTGLDLLNDIFNNYIKSAGAAVSDVAAVAKNKFPFCIPGALVTAFVFTKVDAQPPTFYIPFKYDRLGIDEVIVIDFASDVWKGCRQVIWLFTFFLFVIGMMHLTIQMTEGGAK